MVHWINIDATDNCFLFILKFEQYENANNANFVCFEKILLIVSWLLLIKSPK